MDRAAIPTFPHPQAGSARPAGAWRLVHSDGPMPQAAAEPPEPHKGHPMKKLTLSTLVVIASLPAASAALAQDVAAGKTSFNKCMACHSIGEGAKNKIGPELNGLDGRKSGTVPDYSTRTPTRIRASPGTR